MSRLEETVQLLESYLYDSEPTVPTQYENAESKFEQPSHSEWQHFQVLFGDSFNRAVCDGITRTQSGTVQLYISVPKNTGSQRAMAIADTFVALFSNKQISHVRLFEPFVSVPQPVGNWYQNRVSVRFEYDT